MSQQKKLLLLLLLGVLAWWLWQDHNQQPPQEPVNPAPKQPAPPPAPPKKPDEPKKPRLPKPWGPHTNVRSDVENPDVGSPGKPVEGGKKSPDGAVEMVCDLPEKERKKNIASKGLGCCVFRSMEYCGRFQNEKELYDLPERMVQKGTPGGGYPEKLTKIMQEYCPDVKWGQDTSGDPAVLEAVLKSGRPAGVTYDGHDVHYGGSIAHMVQCVYYDRGTGWAAISDNNFIKDTQYVWMSCDEFNKRWKGGGGGWCAFLLASPPPPVPHND